MAGALRRAGPDVVHAHWTYQYALAALASGVPTLITVRDWAPTILRHRPTPFRVVRSLMNVATLVKGQHFTVTSPYMQIRMERWLRRDIPLIPNAIGDDLFLTECLPRPNDIPVILAINNGFSRRKNVPVLLRAFQRVRSIHPPARLRLAGEGYEIHGVAHQWARKKRLEDGVEFLGSRAHHEVVQLLDEATIFAHPAIEESFGLVLVEAMARGVPVIGGESSGAVPWVLGGGHAGVLVDIASEEELTEALLGLLEDKERRDTLAHAALEHARANFRIGAVLGRYSQLYEAIQQEVDSSSWT
jgi:glycosyltransferase involved in cell wall biosynthesis